MLREEVAALKSKHESDRLGMSTYVSQIEAKSAEVHDVLEKDRRERDLLQKELMNKVSDLERDLPGFNEELAALRSQIRGIEATLHPHIKDLQSAFYRDAEDRANLHGKIERRLGELDECVAKHSLLHQDVERKLLQHKETVDKEQEAGHARLTDLINHHGANLEKEKQDRNFHHGTLNDRLDKLEKDIQSSVAKRMSNWEEELQEVRRLLGGESCAREDHHRSITSAIQKHLNTEKEVREQLHSELKDAVHGKISDHGRQLNAHSASVQERLDYLEKCLGDSADHHAQELQAMRVKLKDIDELKHSHIKLQGAHDIHGRELESSKTVHTKVATIEERLSNLEHEIGGHAEKNSEDMTGAHGRIDQLHGRLAQLEERHQTSHAELKKSHVSMASEKAAQDAHHASLKERVDYVEKLLGDSADKHSRALDAAQVRLDQLHGRLSSCERHGSTLEELKKAHGMMQTDKTALDSHHATLKERVDFLETFVGESADKHTKELENLKALHTKTTADAKAQHGKINEQLEKEKNARDSHHATMQERLTYMETLLGDSAEKHDAHMKEIEGLRSTQAKHAADLKSHHGKLTDQVTKEREARDFHHASVQERLDYLESALGQSADKHEKHTKALEDQKAMHGKLASELRSREASHATLAERIAYVEKCMGDSADKHAQEIAAAVSKLDVAHNRITDERMARETHTAALETLKKAQSSLASEKQVLEKNHATMAERLEYLEKAMGDSADKHAREVENLKMAHQKFSVDNKNRDTIHAAGSERIDQLQREKEDLQARHLSLGERVEYLEKMIGDNAERHAQELEHVKSTTAKRLDDLDGVKKLHAAHATTEERINYIEKSLGDSANKHAQELGNALSKLDQLHGKIMEERSSRESLNNHVRDHLSSEQKARDSHHASVQERLQYLEKVIGDNADKHAKDLDDHKNTFGKAMGENKTLHERHAGVTERIAFLEQAIGESADKHAQELAATHTKLEQIHSRLSDEKASRDAHANSMRDLVNKEREAREGHHASVGKRLDYLEGLIGSNADKHAIELEACKIAQNKHSSDSKARDAAHASMEDRIAYLEKSMGDSADKHAKELQDAVLKLDQVHGRLSTVEKHGDHIDELKKSHASMASQKTQLDAQHATLRERVEYLESSLGESADRHNKALADIRSAHSKLTTDVKTKEASHNSVSERLTYLEKAIGDSAAKHAQEIAAAHAKIEAVHGRLATCEAHGGHIDALKKSHAALASDRVQHLEHRASVTERLDIVEKALSASIEHNSKDVTSLRTKIDQLHNKIGDERHAREGHHAATDDHLSREKHAREVHQVTLEDRLRYLESYLGESAQRQAKDFQAHHGNLQQRLGQLEQQFGSELAELREHLTGEKNLRAQHADAITEHLEAERRAREAHELSTSNTLIAHKKGMEAHEQMVREQFGHERCARDQHFEHVQAVMTRDREAKEKHHEMHTEHIQREASIRETAHRDLHEAIVKERALREQHHATYHESLLNERAARQQMEDLVAQERQERCRHQESVAERVDSLQRTVGIFDSLIRKEMDERAKESKRVWDAIDNHTHDLSTHVMDGDADRGDDGGAGVVAHEQRALTQTPVLQAPGVARSPSSPAYGLCPHSRAESPNAVVRRVVQAPQMTKAAYPAQVRSQSPLPEPSMRQPCAYPSMGTTVSVPVMPVAGPPAVTYAAPTLANAGRCYNSSPSRGLGRKCRACDNILMPDAKFCRICGTHVD
eukprot:TRINITY_DN72938_c0_g1_i1.p1 TRINITY_DN72938_c0_g1~~TRINITY_DN72938_c0_g1_i1.p1  ORF type:complete len:1818 (+),score=410.71 TRINITY_DN72938_c0_g1_i1:251-5455(+)